MCLCIYKIYILYLQRPSCLFCEKGKKASELVFFVWEIIFLKNKQDEILEDILKILLVKRKLILTIKIILKQLTNQIIKINIILVVEITLRKFM